MKGSGSVCIIGIAGGTGAGKSCVTEKLRSLCPESDGVSVLDQDSYYRDLAHLPAVERQGVNFDDPSALDHDLLLSHLHMLVTGMPVPKPRYCFATHSRSEGVDMIAPAPIIVVEGIFALYDVRIRGMMDFKIYVDADADLRFIRRLQRDINKRGRTVNSVINQYLESVRPMHELFIEPTRAFANIVLENKGSFEHLLSRVQSEIAPAVLYQGSFQMTNA